MPGLAAILRRMAGVPPRPPQDGRGRRVVAAIECIQNQNARDPGAAAYRAGNERVLRACAAHGVGIVQIPCPERECLGLRRHRPPGTSIRTMLDSPAGRACCASLAEAVADRLLDYARNGCAVVAVLGGNARSPGCAVHPDAVGLSAPSGVFMRELARALGDRGLAVPFRGIRDADPAAEREDLEWLERRLATVGRPPRCDAEAATARAGAHHGRRQP